MASTKTKNIINPSLERNLEVFSGVEGVYHFRLVANLQIQMNFQFQSLQNIEVFSKFFLVTK